MKCFKVFSGDIEERLDAFFYSPDNRVILRSKHPLIPIQEITEDIIHPPEYERLYTQESNPGVQLLRAQNVRSFGININNNPVFFDSTFLDGKRTIQPRIGDVLVVRSGVNAGDTATIEENYPNAIIGADNLLLRCTQTVIPKFLQVFFFTNAGKKQMNRFITGATNKHITPENLGKIKIPLPPKELQKKCVSIFNHALQIKKQKEAEAERLLDSIDDFVLGELGIRMPEVKDKMCFALDSSEIQSNRVDAYYHQPKFCHLVNALNNSQYTIKNLGEFITKIHYGASLKNEYVDDGIPFLRILNLNPNYIDLRKVVMLPKTRHEEIGNAFVYEGDMLISRSGSVGIVSVVSKGANGFAFGSFMIRFCLNDEINKDFVSIWLNNRFSKIFIEREKIGAIQGNITIETIRNFKIPTPSLKLQNEIASKVHALTQQADNLRNDAQAELDTTKARVEKMILGKEK